MTEEDSYDLCITVESLDTPITGWSLWSGYENLTMEELNCRFKHWNTECKYGNMDIAEAAVKVKETIGELTLLPRKHYNDITTLKKWLRHFETRKSPDPDSSDTSSGSRKNQNSIVKSFRHREIMGAADPSHRFFSVECFKNMKLAEQRFTQGLCRVKHMLFDHRGEHVIVASSTNHVQIWNLKTFRHDNFIIRHGYDFHHIKYIELSADESLLLVGTTEGVLVVWDYKRRVELETEQICQGHFKHFELLPKPINGNYCLAIMDLEGDMALWRLCYPKIIEQSNVIMRTYGPEPHVLPRFEINTPEYREENIRYHHRKIAANHCTFSISSCGSYVARTTPNSMISLYTFNQNSQLVHISNRVLTQESTVNIVWAHHRPRFVTSSRLSHAMVWDANSNPAMTLKSMEKNIAPGVAKAYWTADDVWIITASITYTCIYVWDSVNGTIVNLIKTDLGSIAPHPVLSQLLATVVYGEIQLWDLTQPDTEPTHTFCIDNHFEQCDASTEIFWSPDGIVLMGPRSDGKLSMFNLIKGIPVIHVPTRAERLERRWKENTARNIPNNADTSNNSSVARTRSP